MNSEELYLLFLLLIYDYKTYIIITIVVVDAIFYKKKN